MTNNNQVGHGPKIVSEMAKDFLFFPFWWYTKGLYSFLLYLSNFLGERQRSLAFLVWLKNIFRPMYGQTDFSGIMISIFIRLVQIVFRGFIMLLWLIFCFLAFAFWLALPVAAYYGVLMQIK